MSHDLRNPLQVLQGARQTGEAAHFERGQQAIDRMETLIDDVLSLARQGQPIDETEAVSLSALVDECWNVVEAEDARLVVDSEREFVADPDCLRQLLENLFRNAVEHGGTDVTVRVGATEDGFYVADDGPGIPASERDAVFESGYSTADDGTRFGLAIVSEIVEAHGWSITVAEADGGGARFEITRVAPPRPPAPGEAA